MTQIVDGTAVLQDAAFASVAGSVRVNEAAGAENEQANVAALSSGSRGAGATLMQQTTPTVNAGGTAALDGSVFSYAIGLVQVNQTAGAGNAEGNVAIVRTSVPADELSDSALAAVIPVQLTGAAPGASTNGDVASSSPAAFAHASGIVQINQSAGTGNRTANVFFLQTQQGIAP